MRRTRAGAGFTLVEALLATALVMVVGSAALAVARPLQRVIQVETEQGDMQQRLRVTVDALSRDLAMAGNGATAGPHRGPLTSFFPAVLPFRRGLRLADEPGVVKSDTITLLSAPPGGPQTTLAAPMAAQSGDATVVVGAGCPVGDPACGFVAGMDVAVYDDAGHWDVFSVTGVSGSVLHALHNGRDAPRSYAPGSQIVQVTSRTYYLKADARSATYQVVQYDGGRGNDVPVVDHVVALGFDYFGDPRPPAVRRPPTDLTGPWTSYGPRPPAAGTQPTAFPAGENCVFTRDATGTPMARLDALAGSTSPVPLDVRMFTDGPWCPDALDPDRVDADLLRIRRVAVTIRVESADDALRGPASVLFRRSGTAAGGTRLPDLEARIDVTPRNLNLGP